MEEHLLLNEKKFHELNLELELKTQELLKEVENVMKIQDPISKNTTASHKTKNEILNSRRTERQDVTVNTSQEATGHARTSNSRHHNTSRYQNAEKYNILPEPCLEMGSEGMVRFLKAKLKALETEMQTLHSDYKKKNDACHELQTELKSTEEERDRWQHQAVTLRETVRKLEEHNSEITAKLNLQERDNATLKKELEAVRKELRVSLQTTSGTEVRLNRSLEEVEKLHTALKTYKQDDKELRSLVRRRAEEAAGVVRRLEKQKSELLHGFKQQMMLITNLRTQKDLLQSACLIQFTEKEFLQLLDWCPHKKTS